MSQYINYTQVMTVHEAENYQRQFAPTIAQVLNKAPWEVTASVKRCCKQTSQKSQKLFAPSEMRVIQTNFNKYLKIAQTNHSLGETEQLKVAAVATLVSSQNNLLISDSNAVAGKIQHILHAKSIVDAKSKIKSAFKEIKAQHATVFTSHVLVAVKESAIAVGFDKIKIHEEQKGVRLIATNRTGQNLIAEIENDNQINIHTELLGFMDGSCKHVMCTFDQEMVARGISTANKAQKAKQSRHRTFSDELLDCSMNADESIAIKY